ncbi:YppE family protein [Robertmurraya sp.]|uniref:YppE family protein n=1 Tax=Robertmurraya sp. TaxID=2837525 RepID=UPI003704C54F
MDNHSMLGHLNERLYEYTKEIEDTFLSVKMSGEKGDFFTKVKPFADEVKEVVDRWKMESASWIEENRPKNLHATQIESAAEQMEMISVQAFFPETSRTRFINYLQSVRYVLTILRANINKYET